MEEIDLVPSPPLPGKQLGTNTPFLGIQSYIILMDTQVFENEEVYKAQPSVFMWKG